MYEASTGADGPDVQAAAKESATKTRDRERRGISTSYYKE
jgi:hypothetical protein